MISASLPGSLAAPLLALAQAARDTVFVVQAKPGWQLWIEALAAVATIVVALALLFAGAGAIWAGLKVKKLTARLDEQAQKLRVDTAPAVANVTAVTENLNFISRSVREDVERLSDTVTAANRRLRRAAEVAEERVGEFNALLGVVQEEAEDFFIGGAATMRGLRAGSEAFRRFQDEEEDDDARPLPRGDAGWGDEDDDRLTDDEHDLADHALTDDDLTDEELEIRVARRDARRGIDPDQVF